jgi:hypothetical protein
MDAQLRYTQMGFEVIAAIDRGAHLDVEEMSEQIDSDGLFQWLHEKEPDIDQSLYLDADRAAMLRFFKRRGNAADARRKFGVEENGLCLLAAYCFEGLQHENRNKVEIKPVTDTRLDQPLRRVETIIRKQGDGGGPLAILSEAAVWPPVGSVFGLGDQNRAAPVRSVRMNLGPTHVSITIEVEDDLSSKEKV